MPDRDVPRRDFKTILVSGGSGFVGSNLIRYLLTKAEFAGRVINLDALTYAGNPENLADIEERFGVVAEEGRNTTNSTKEDKGKKEIAGTTNGTKVEGDRGRYVFVKADIRDRAAVEKVFSDHAVDAVCHLAAESHVDRSIVGPEAFITTNVLGTFTLLDAARGAWGDRKDVLFHHVSTDEVYGSLGETGWFTEATPYDPRSPYSASKAGSDHLVMAYGHTYGIPVTLSNCSNNYGPFQFPEKLVPLMILNMLEGKPLPVYGDGRNIRDWLYVEDHNAAVWTIMTRGEPGRTYNIGGENEWENIRLLGRLIEIVAEEAGLDPEKIRSRITYVKDRPGHDRRYAIDCSRIKSELGWRRSVDFDEGLRATVRWYLDNRAWCERVRSGEYRKWLSRNYEAR